jgi:4-amino-4-deoxy-L-arabinose transferase-like glycosyltransferase
MTLAEPRLAPRTAPTSWTPSATRLGLLAVLAIAIALRFWGLTHDLPFSYFGDELHFMKLSIGMGTGDLNPHWFHKPAFLMYVLAFCYGLYFGWGRALGHFDSTAAFGAHFLTDSGPFLLIGRLVVCAFGVAVVYVVYRLARRAFGSVEAGLAAGLVTAVMAPMVFSSQDIKSDIPCAFLIAFSVYLYLGVRETESRRPLIFAALVAGAAMGTHYYAVVLVPTYLAMELLRALERPAAGRWRRLLGRGGLVVGLFLAGFFVTSPYNFLDPTWIRENLHSVEKTFGHGQGVETGAATKAEPEAAEGYEPDSGTRYQPGSRAWGGAAVKLGEVLVAGNSMGTVLALLAGLGFAVVLARRETRWYGLLVLVPTAIFFLFAITIAAYHAQPRHLNAIFPLLATLVWPGVEFLARLLPVPRRWVPAVALGLVALAAVPSAARAGARDARISREDSRLAAYRWLVANLPHDTRILVDDYGPILQPGREAVRRQQALLRALPVAPFTQHQALRLELLERYPPRDAMNIEELGHPWWLPHEKSDALLRSTPSDLDMGSPLVSRQPQPLAAYRAMGIRYIVTNSEARDLYFGKGKNARGGFPSFVRFYQELSRAPLVKTFDPAAWGGKGPVIWIYDLAGSPAAKPAEVPAR